MSRKHQGRCLSSLAAFRSRLLQFTLLFTYRYHPSQTWTNKESLQRLRDHNTSRYQRWQKAHNCDELAFRNAHPSNDEVKSARERRALALGLPSSFHLETGSNSGRPSLHEIISLFVELTAARASLGDEWQPKSDWFDLAGQFMFQAVIDQYLIFRECSSAVMMSIFAFGTVGTEREDGEGSDIRSMRRLFCRDDQSAEELPEWTAVRSRYTKEVCWRSWSHLVGTRLLTGCRRPPYVPLRRSKTVIRTSSFKETFFHSCSICTIPR
jgi:hypothetical protein